MSYISSTGLYSDYCEQQPVTVNLNLGNVFENQSNQLIGLIKNTSNELIEDIDVIKYNYQQVLVDTDKNALIKGDKMIEFEANNYMEPVSMKKVF